MYPVCHIAACLDVDMCATLSGGRRHHRQV